MLSGRNHELFSIVLMGVATALLFLGYNVQNNIAESVIHSVHKSNPNAISEFAGYYGQAIHYFSFAVFSLFSAAIHNFISSKNSLVIVCVIFSFFYVGFFFVNGFYYYFTQILMGFGYAIYNNAEGSYLAEHSSEKTLISNTGIETGVGHTSMIGAGIFFLTFNYFFAESGEQTTAYRNFSLTFIQITYSALLVITLLAGIVFAFLPKKQQPDSIAYKSVQPETSLKVQFKKFWTALTHQNMIFLAITFFYQGFNTSFFMGIYPTTLSFTSTLKNDVYVVGCYSLFLGLAEMSSFLVLRPIMQKWPKHKLIVVIVVHLLSVFSVVSVIFCSVPDEATIRPSGVDGLLLQPGRLIVCLTGFLLGLSDYTITMARGVICQLAIPESRAQVFSLTRIFQSIAACLVLFTSPHLTILHWVWILSIGATIGTISFTVVARRTAHLITPRQNYDDISVSRF